MLEYLPDTGVGAIWLVVFLLALAIQLYYFYFTYMRIAVFKPIQQTTHQPPVSVIICARNEEENLAKFLPKVLEQEYPHFEVVVVNDCSFDKSIDVLKSFAHHYSNLKVADIREVEGREHGKKFALTIGIKAASYETLLLIDADCYPSDKQWIQKMMSAYAPGKQIVLGYGKYEPAGGLLNTLIRFDAFFIGVQYLSYALKGNPYMGVGRNLSYHRSLFFQVKGFASHMHIQSGDDDLFINQVANAQNTSVVIDKEAFTVSKPKQTWRTWFLQKKRHHTTASYYRTEHKSSLALYPFSWYLFVASAIGGLFFEKNLLIISVGILLRTITQIVILHTAANKLAEKNLGWLSPVLEIIHRIFVYPTYILSTMFVKQRRWN
ncbi:MAG: glycosyltransferase [Bacteroidia bacterium]|jgi:glycosyltransferase involved in cell wall biosynthesis|nr:glycosyltransferase [Bacteroidia bacterium]